MSTNKGRGNRVKVLTDVKKLGISSSIPMDPPMKKNAPTILMSMKQKATGSPIVMRTIRLPKITMIINHHSTEGHLAV